MKRTYLFIILLAVIVLILGGVALSSQQQDSPQEPVDENVLQGDSVQIENVDLVFDDQIDLDETETLKRSTDDDSAESTETTVPGEVEDNPTEPEVLGDVDKTQLKYTFFYGDTCPYCHDVIDWFEANGIEAQLNLERKEVYNNPANNQQLQLAAQTCGNASSGGVPLLFTPEKDCIVGSTPIIDYLTDKHGF